MVALEDAVHSLVRRLDPPMFIQGELRRYLYAKRTSQHIQILKAVRIVSGLYAAVVLIRTGFTQEAGVIFRTIDEFVGDIDFLDEAHLTEPNEAQKRFVEEFFAQDLRTTEEMMEGTPKVDRVPQKKKRASEARTLGAFENVDTMRRRLEATDDVLSGYVHGSYPNIMQMYGGTDTGMNEGFHMHGMLGTPRVEEFQLWLGMFVHPALNTVAMLLHDVRDLERKDKLIDIRNRLEASDEYPGAQHKKPKPPG
jgi:hypothetical protein